MIVNIENNIENQLSWLQTLEHMLLDTLSNATIGKKKLIGSNSDSYFRLHKMPIHLSQENIHASTALTMTNDETDLTLNITMTVYKSYIEVLITQNDTNKDSRRFHYDSYTAFILLVLDAIEYTTGIINDSIHTN